jgi:hypothetical protein
MDAYKVVNIYWRITDKEEGQKFLAQHYYDVLRRPRVNFINVLQAAFTREDPK